MSLGTYSIFKTEKGFALRMWKLKFIHNSANEKLMAFYICFLGSDIDRAIEKANNIAKKDDRQVDLVNVFGFKNEYIDEIAHYSEPEIISSIAEEIRKERLSRYIKENGGEVVE